MKNNNSNCRFITGNEAALLEYVQTPTYRGECTVPLPEFMGVTLQSTIGKVAFNKLSGMPVVVFPYIHNNVSGLLETDDQRIIFRALKDAGLGQAFLHESIMKGGKILPSFEGTQELIVAGKFAGMDSTDSMDTAVVGDIALIRSNQIVIDNSMKYIYNELAAVNGQFDSQVTDETTARMLFRSGLDKASEALNPLKGDGLQGVLRRNITMDSLLQFQHNKNPQLFVQMIQEFVMAIQNNLQSGQVLQTQTLKVAGNGEKLVADRTLLAKAIQEEAEAQRQVYLQQGNCPRQVNQIDEAFVLELLNSLNNKEAPSLSTATLNSEVFDTNAIQSAAKLVSMVNKTAKGSITTDQGPMPFFPEAVSPLTLGDAPVVNKFSMWLSNKTGSDMSQLAMMYLVETGANYMNIGNNDVLFGVQQPQVGPVTADQLIFGNPQTGQHIPTPTNPNGLPTSINDALNKLAQNQGVAVPGQMQMIAPPVTINPQPAQPQFGTPVVPQVNQPNVIQSYNNSMNMQQPNQNSGGNNMYLSNQYGQAANFIEVIVSADPSQVFLANPQKIVNTQYGQAAEIYTKAGVLSGYGVVQTSTALNLQGIPVGSVTPYQAPVAPMAAMAPQLTPQMIPQMVQPTFGQPIAQPQFNIYAQPQSIQPTFAQPIAPQSAFGMQPQLSGYGVPQLAGFQSQPAAQPQPQFNMYAQPQPIAQPTFGVQPQANFGQQELRPNPITGMGQKIMELI